MVGGARQWRGSASPRPGASCEGKGWPTMVMLAGEGKERMGNGSNGDGFTKQNARRCRGDLYEPLDGLGIRRGHRSWPKKLAEHSPEKFTVGTSAIYVGQMD